MGLCFQSCAGGSWLATVWVRRVFWAPDCSLGTDGLYTLFRGHQCNPIVWDETTALLNHGILNDCVRCLIVVSRPSDRFIFGLIQCKLKSIPCFYLSQWVVSFYPKKVISSLTSPLNVISDGITLSRLSCQANTEETRLKHTYCLVFVSRIDLLLKLFSKKNLQKVFFFLSSL